VIAQDVGDLMAAGLFGDDGRGGHGLLLVRRRSSGLAVALT
jgi:hypothetical protein